MNSLSWLVRKITGGDRVRKIFLIAGISGVLAFILFAMGWATTIVVEGILTVNRARCAEVITAVVEGKCTMQMYSVKDTYIQCQRNDGSYTAMKRDECYDDKQEADIAHIFDQSIAGWNKEDARRKAAGEQPTPRSFQIKVVK